MTISMRRTMAGLAMLALLVMPVTPVWTEANARGAASRGGGGGGHSAGGRSGGGAHGGGAHGGGARSAAPRSAPSSRPSGGASSRPSGGTATRSTAARGAPPRTASGRATYGYGTGSYGYPGYPWYGYGYPGWGLDFYWGWGWPWYGGYYPYYPYYPSEPVDVYADLGPARIELDVSPRKATILLDGEPAGRVKDWDGRWDRLPVEAGARVLTFEAAGYKTLRVRVDASSGGQYRVAYDLAAGEGMDSRSTSTEVRAPQPPPLPAGAEMNSVHVSEAPSPSLVKGFLRIHVTPADAAVYLDGEYFARADELARLRGAVPLVVGTHAVEAVRPGFESGKVDVEIAADKPAEVALDLQKRP